MLAIRYPGFIPRQCFSRNLLNHGRGGGTRTHDLLYPKQARYQAAPHPDQGISVCPQWPRPILAFTTVPLVSFWSLRHFSGGAPSTGRAVTPQARIHRRARHAQRLVIQIGILEAAAGSDGHPVPTGIRFRLASGSDWHPVPTGTRFRLAPGSDWHKATQCTWQPRVNANRPAGLPSTAVTMFDRRRRVGARGSGRTISRTGRTRGGSRTSGPWTPHSLMMIMVVMPPIRMPAIMTMPTARDIAIADDCPVGGDNGRGRGHERGLRRRRVRRTSHDEDAQTEKTQKR